MAAPLRTPAELRSMFGANLRHLAQNYPSVSELCRQLGINRTQFNRYLLGESFPRPDVLARMCAFFDVDARILLDPVDDISSGDDPLSSDVLRDFVRPGLDHIPEEEFPSGFFRFSRRSFFHKDQYVVGLVRVFRDTGFTYMRGYEPREAMLQQGLPDDAATREFRGYITRQEDGVAAVVSRRNSMTTSFNYLARVPSYENNFWVGYVTRTVRETLTGNRASRMVYEFIGDDLSMALQTARSAGFAMEDDLLAFHKRLLQPGDPFR